MPRPQQYNSFLPLLSYIPNKVYSTGIPVPLRELDPPKTVYKFGFAYFDEEKAHTFNRFSDGSVIQKRNKED